MNITVYGQDDCAYCDELMKYYQRRGIPTQYVNLSNPQNADILQRLKDQGFGSTPIVETSNNAWCGRRKDLEVKSVLDYRTEELQRLEQQQRALTAQHQRELH
ncbi:glutaredoxin family protein [Glutamicibacter uratoxydans]|uniref:glutaredoxin family protein n=1 Tax=Glutamicibacter uratoxydans TaxID=43667 RepID=UPI003D6E3326